MKERFEGRGGRPARLDALQRQKVIRRNDALAETLADAGEVVQFEKGDVLIREGDADTDVYFILAGEFEVRIKGSRVAVRTHDTMVGEFVNFRPSRRRSATLKALQTSVVLKVGWEKMREAVENDAAFWRAMTEEVSERLAERNAALPDVNERPRILVVSSNEGVKIARELRHEVGGDGDIVVEVWDKIFAVSAYPLESLEAAMKRVDFVVAIMRGDDIVVSRKKESPAPRDNVVLEYGMAVGALGRSRALMMVPKGVGTKLASDNSGLVYMSYREDDLETSLPIVGDKIRKHVEQYGVKD